MDRRLVPDGLLLAILSLSFSTPRFALGAPNDAAAQRLRDQALDGDYLSAQYAAAEKKLTEALSLCEKTTNCSPFIRARLHCDLGVVELMLGKLDLARTEFATALVEDPNVALDPSLSSTEAQREFGAVKSGGPPPTVAGSSQGGLAHGPRLRQAVSTPLPPGAPSSHGESTMTAEASDCPPGFPGCHTDEARSCESRDDCTAGQECIERTCQRISERGVAYEKNWVSLGVQAELLFMPGADDACLGDRRYTCFLSSTEEYYADVPTKGVDDQVIAGLASAPMIRILVGYDRALQPNLTVGGRLGYAIVGGGPQRPAHNATPAGPRFMPVHAEVRGAYFLGKNALAHKGLRFFVGLGGGMTEIDASENIDVVRPGLSSARIPVDAWTKTGLGFVSVGPGVMFGLTPNTGPVLEAKAIVLFPTAGVALAAQLGYTFGF